MKLYQADAFEVLPQLEADSFDAVIAAHQMGLDAVGIEKTEANYKTAAARIAELLPSPLI